jgi:hypothetical protein
MKILKVTVSGFINETFVGNDVEVQTYLEKIKSIQDSKLDVTSYKKIMPPFKKSFLNISYLDRTNYTKYQHLCNRLSNPPTELKLFRESAAPYGLKIKIEPHKPHDFF